MDADLPGAALVGRALGPEELDDELVEAAEDGHLVLGLDQLDDVRVHASLAGRGGRHLEAPLVLFEIFEATKIHFLVLLEISQLFALCSNAR